MDAAANTIKPMYGAFLTDAQGEKDFWLMLDWAALEYESFKLLMRLGYEVELTSNGADGGADLKFVKDGKRGIVQCKQHAKVVGSPEIDKFAGAVAIHNAEIAILIAPRGYSGPPKARARAHGIDLWDIDSLLLRASALKN